jgi:outer membrane protein OmpA-like peptidoglycan-associated protein
MSQRYYVLAALAFSACASAPKPRELDAFEAIKAQQSMYQAALRRSPELVSQSEQLLQKSEQEWKDKDLDESRRDALMGQTKLKTAYALVEQDQNKARSDAASTQLAHTEEEYARAAKDLAMTNDAIGLLKKVAAGSAERARMTQQIEGEQRRTAAQQKLADAELALKNADAVNASTYAASDYTSAKDSIDRARMELKQNNYVAASTSADLAKERAEHAATTAKPQHDAAEAGRDQKSRNEELSRDAAALPATTVRLERKGEVQRLILPYTKLFARKMTTITPGTDDALDGVAGLLKKYSTYQVQIVGHTDNRGRKDGLLALSQARAQAVYDALVSRGVEAKRLSATGMGPDVPASDNKTVTGRAANNRVEIILILQ